MKRQIKRISIHQSSKVLALILFVLFAIFMIPAGLFFLIAGDTATALASFAAPFFYLLVGYLTYVFYFYLYNLLAPRVGGIEIDLSDEIDSNK